MNNGVLYLILSLCVGSFSACCTFRNYALFSEPVAALDSAKELQMNGNIGLMRLEANINAAPVNHLGISVSGGLRVPLSARWSANNLQLGAGYFDVYGSHGFEVFGGWGFQNFHVFHDTCQSRNLDFSIAKANEVVISDTFFHYNYFFLQPDVWWNAGAVKLVAAINFKGLGSGDYEFYLKKYNQYFSDTTEQDVSIYQYSGPLHLLLIEPSLQLRFGLHQVRFSMEGKYSFPVTANVNVSKYFSPSTFLFTVGVQFVFHQHDLAEIFNPPHH
ncbi:MAG TPA: hypothetical protein VE978_28280 [Chitinophagales bacterium]|nr:hypothetical protein [Chitinophagales bacterium]